MIEKLMVNEKLKKFWDLFSFEDKTKDIKKYCNNYVHMNSFSHTTRLQRDINKKLIEHYVNLFKIFKSIMIQFIGSIAITNPLLLTSSDYIDYLEVMAKPIENSQFWVAPFVVNFLNEYYPKLIKYLENQTFLIFDTN